MARKPKTEPLFEEEQPTQDEIDLYTFIDEIGPSTAVVEVFRMLRDGSRPHVDRVTMEALREDVYGYLRTLGVGKYLLQFRGTDRRIQKTKVIEVGDKATLPVPTNPAPLVPGTPPDHLQFMREQMAQQQTLIMALIGAIGGSSKGPDLSFLAGVLKPPDMTPVVTLMSAMLNRKDDSTGGGLAMAKQIVELSRDLAPDGGREENWLSVVKDVGGQFMKTLGARVEANGGYTPAALPPVTTTEPVPTVHNPTDGENMRVTQANFASWLRSGLTVLKEKAARGKDIDLMVDYILENPEEPQWSAVAGAVQQGATFDHLLQFDPEIAQTPVLADWFRKFYDALHAEIFGPVDTAGTGGNPDNAGDHAGHGPSGPMATPGPGSS